jgi:hypothetical protein
MKLLLLILNIPRAKYQSDNDIVVAFNQPIVRYDKNKNDTAWQYRQ